MHGAFRSPSPLIFRHLPFILTWKGGVMDARHRVLGPANTQWNDYGGQLQPMTLRRFRTDRASMNLRISIGIVTPSWESN